MLIVSSVWYLDDRSDVLVCVLDNPALKLPDTGPQPPLPWVEAEAATRLAALLLDVIASVIFATKSIVISSIEKKGIGTTERRGTLMVAVWDTRARIAPATDAGVAGGGPAAAAALLAAAMMACCATVGVGKSATTFAAACNGFGAAAATGAACCAGATSGETAGSGL